MTIKECIDIVDNIKPNQYTVKDKVMWLSFIDEIIINEVLKTHEGYDGRYDDFEGYSEDKLSTPLIVSSPYDRLYTAYLKMKIDSENGETARYNNSATLYNTYMMEYRRHYNKTHMPLSSKDILNTKPVKKVSEGLSEAEYENLKRDLYFLLTEDVNKIISPDKLYEIVTNYVNNNAEMLKGKDGYTPKKGVDYFTDSEISEIEQNVNEKVAGEAPKARIANVFLRASAWSGDASPYSQIVNINGVTARSQVDLTPSAEQLAIFHNKDLAFVTENVNGTVTVYVIGQKPENDYIIQTTITEVNV